MSASDKPAHKPSDVVDTTPDVLPAARGSDHDLSTVHLTVDDVRNRLAARERDMRYHIEALKHEAMTVLDDVNVEGRPLMDRIREKPEEALALAGGVAALVGFLWGLRRRAQRRPETDEDIAFIKARLGVALDHAAHRVAAGSPTDEALREAMEEMPVVYGDASKLKPSRSSRKLAADAALTAAAGFLATSLADMAIRRFTGHTGALDALTSD